ncbi:hypothetical protein BN2497_2525 [Janthinobacterium sp. CG23_2]|nr:hypothetical protein BN2497_2525 [Janthinobacterium sp. CG23_2]CUU27660.1 hypothetical protein BN3177_2525 [Janthinobacterium sp. CG23_2]
MKIARTHDMAAVQTILSHPKIAPHIGEDGAGGLAPIDHDGFYWMLVDDGAPAGVFLLHARNARCMEMHTCLLPRIWGAGAARAAQLLLAWAFEETECQKVVTSVPAYNRAAVRFARAGGMTQEGVNRASFLRGGAMIDQIELGITKQEWKLCQQQSR